MNKFFENEVIESVYNSALATKLEIAQFVTVDTLAPEDGLVKRINKYSTFGAVEDLGIGEGNTGSIEIGFTTKDYTVGTTQGRFSYRDEEAVKDPFAVEKGIKGLAEAMVNDANRKAVKEWLGCTKQQVVTGSLGFDAIVDGLAQIENADDGELSLSLIVSIDAQASLRKALKDDLKYVEAFTRTGYIGHVAGMPIYASRLVPNGEAFIVDKAAVRVFLQPATEIEQERDANTRTNTIYSRKLSVTALVDDTHVCHFGRAASTTATITTKSGTTIAGAGAGHVEAYVNGVFAGAADASGSSYSITLGTALKSGDAIVVRAHADGEVVSIATATV